MPDRTHNRILDSSIRLRVMVGIFTLVIIASVAFIPTQSTIRNAFKQTLSHKPEPITELYFTEPELIPTTYTPGQIIELPFTVHNLENKNMKYYFQIALNDQVVTTEPKNVNVQNGDTYRANQKIFIHPEQSGDLELSISLQNMPQSIHVRLQRNEQ